VAMRSGGEVEWKVNEREKPKRAKTFAARVFHATLSAHATSLGSEHTTQLVLSKSFDAF
jgi:hypothetical protein